VEVGSSCRGDHNDEGVVHNHEGGMVGDRSLCNHESVVVAEVGSYPAVHHNHHDFYQVASSVAFLFKKR